MDKFAGLVGRKYELFEYFGAPDAERVIILMGSGAKSPRKPWTRWSRRARRLG